MINTRKCFIRFNRNVLDEGLHRKIITTEEYGLIQKFWNDSILHNIKAEDVTFLKSLKFECETHDSGLKITSYPHLKLMCLKVCKKNPKLWRYEDEENGNFLFGLIISVDESLVIKSEKEITEE